MINLGTLTDWIQISWQVRDFDQRVRGGPHRQHVREPHRHLPRHSGRILRARGNRRARSKPNNPVRQRGFRRQHLHRISLPASKQKCMIMTDWIAFSPS